MHPRRSRHMIHCSRDEPRSAACTASQSCLAPWLWPPFRSVSQQVWYSQPEGASALPSGRQHPVCSARLLRPSCVQSPSQLHTAHNWVPPNNCCLFLFCYKCLSIYRRRGKKNILTHMFNVQMMPHQAQTAAKAKSLEFSPQPPCGHKDWDLAIAGAGSQNGTKGWSGHSERGCEPFSHQAKQPHTPLLPLRACS